jgi:hypothetical protein
MRRASELSFLVAVLLASGCAHGSKLATKPERDEEALAQAFMWIVRTTPPARRYVFNIDGAPPSGALARKAAAVSGLTRIASHFENPNADASATPLLSIHAARPVWSGPPDQVRVDASYYLGDTSVPCVVVLRHPAGKQDQWYLSYGLGHFSPSLPIDFEEIEAAVARSHVAAPCAEPLR